MDNELLLYSGGMDSYIAWHYLSKPKTMYIDIHHRYNTKERVAILRTIPSTIILDKQLDLGKYEKLDADIPMRNLFLVMMAAMEGGKKIWLIIQKDETSIPDRTLHFLDEAAFMVNNLLECNDVEIKTPFESMDKTDMVKWYNNKVGDIDSLLKTVGCYEGDSDKYINSDNLHCGDCGACLRRFVALANNGVDPGYELSERIKSEYRNKISNYSIERQERMLEWIQNR